MLKRGLVATSPRIFAADADKMTERQRIKVENTTQRFLKRCLKSFRSRPDEVHSAKFEFSDTLQLCLRVLVQEGFAVSSFEMVPAAVQPPVCPFVIGIKDNIQVTFTVLISTVIATKYLIRESLKQLAAGRIIERKALLRHHFREILKV